VQKIAIVLIPYDSEGNIILRRFKGIKWVEGEKNKSYKGYYIYRNKHNYYENISENLVKKDIDSIISALKESSNEVIENNKFNKNLRSSRSRILSPTKINWHLNTNEDILIARRILRLSNERIIKDYYDEDSTLPSGFQEKKIMITK